jgi:hypothetical protein
MDAMAWSTRIAEKVNAISEVPVSLWSTVFSPRLGALSWTAVVDDLSQLEALDAKLLADGGYVSLVEEGARFTSDEGIDDAVVQLIHADPDGAAGGQYATVVQAVITPAASCAPSRSVSRSPKRRRRSPVDRHRSARR